MIKGRPLTKEFILDYPGGPQRHLFKSFIGEGQWETLQIGNVSMGAQTGAM